MASNLMCFEEYIPTHTEYDVQSWDYAYSRLWAIIQNLLETLFWHTDVRCALKASFHTVQQIATRQLVT